MQKVSWSPPAIEDYAIIGDCRSAALVSRDCSVDWLCWRRFDSPSLFAAILDPKIGGRFRVGSAGPCPVSRRYVGETSVLETTFVTDTGVLRLTDLMPVDSEDRKCGRLWAAHHVLRWVECLEGEVEIEILCDPRPGYGREACRLADRGPLGLYFERRGRAFIPPLGEEAVLRRLGTNGLVYRYRGFDDGLPGDEGAFGSCSFWAVGAYALAGETETAEALFDRVLGHANDLGLFAEEIDPADGAALGNFPQAFTHVGLIDAALMLDAARAGDGVER